MIQTRNKRLARAEQGLTVGELTITIGIVLLISLVWITFRGNKESSKSQIIQPDIFILESSINNRSKA